MLWEVVHRENSDGKNPESDGSVVRVGPLPRLPLRGREKPIRDSTLRDMDRGEKDNVDRQIKLMEGKMGGRDGKVRVGPREGLSLRREKGEQEREETGKENGEGPRNAEAYCREQQGVMVKR
uniref:Uncharacterized protein n=1 Tax=Chromera velia CCMP2878 TaxID=1169474 RepID=A0A0G4HW08_9ALVE|eukprot:Cvel_8908.t1-p1 / transcript=Cvel_8908.t1 / gene=Cvel_8908 / organism=Chromera_velia_CCMP2878 / gene_product=hypothetical protein / transcript_product=hypothetical protein / location=Cvel_scaffold501:64285-66670(-) / protein_length=121 / sequence_SO=supercontig / SO=protein_coding / is_pseudo=false